MKVLLYMCNIYKSNGISNGYFRIRRISSLKSIL